MRYGNTLTTEFAHLVYTVLVLYAGASESMRDNFIYAHADKAYPCMEYRFGGKFGFGGKYWSDTNKISYYFEDRTKKLDKLERKINNLLKSLEVVNLIKKW